MYFVRIKDNIVAYGLSSESEALAVAEQWLNCFPELFGFISICKVISHV